ncbi:MDR family MFS transporter [soil metagenome]
MSFKQRMIVFVAVLASLLEILDASIVNVALPNMMGNLGATLEDISMVITGYAIANAVVLPLSSWMAERFGRRPYYITCIVLFTVTSVACGFAPNLETLIVFRILQGLAGGALLPTSQALIYEQFPPEKAGMAGAIFGMSVMVGPALGPVLGGYLTDSFGWRSIFNVNLPLGLLAFFVAMAVIEEPEHMLASKGKPKGKLDAIGLALLVAGIGCLQFVLERGDADEWFQSKLILTNAIIAAIALPTFVWWELKDSSPIINIRLFKDSVVSGGVLLMGAVGFFLYSIVFLLPVFAVRVFHYNATQIGELFIPGSILTMMVMPIVGKQMAAGRSSKALIFIGLVSIEVCLYSMTLFSPLSSKNDILIMLFLRGFGMAFLFVPINSAILSQFKGSTVGQVSGLLNLSRQIGGSVGIALVATLLSRNSHQNYIDLVSHVSLLNANTQQVYQQSIQGMAGKMSEGVGMGQAVTATLQALKHRVDNQVFMMSFNQLIWMVMGIFALSFIPLYLMKFRARVKVVSDSH